MSVPKHVAIIMDGNGRWAHKRKLPRYFGHREGVNALKRIVKYCADEGLEILTVYAFSTENWQRPTGEVNYLLKLMEEIFSKEINELIEQGVCIKILGDLSTMSAAHRDIWKTAEAKTHENSRLNLNVAFNYGGRNEITNAARRIAEDVKSGDLSIERITEAEFAKYLYTGDTADPDLVIRTGGEYRMSNFLLWQSAYSEWYFTDVLWPDFDVNEFEKALLCYSKRHRRYGRIKGD